MAVGRRVSLAVQDELGLAAAGLLDLGVLPGHSAREPGADRLEGRLLGGETRGQVGQRVLVPAAVLQLGRGEQAVLHALPEPREGL